MKRWSVTLAGLVLGAALGIYAGRAFLQGQPPVITAVPKELTSYRDIVKKVLPAVVSIESRARPVRTRQRRRAPIDNSQIPEEFRRFFDELPDQPDDEGPGRYGFGSGFIVDPKGVILTNFHVVDGADQVEVRLLDGRKFVSKDIKTDSKSDLAIVRIQPKGPLPYLELGDSAAMEIGDRVLAVGAPFGLTGTVTNGIISAKGRALRMNMYEDFIQTDAAINPGNSGGPLVNLEGKVIGINSVIKSRSGGFQGVGMAIASNLARNIMQQLLQNGVVRRGYLGVQIQDVDSPELATRLGLKEAHGAIVTRVFEDTPGSKAGLKSGDVIVNLAGKPVKDGRELQGVVAGLTVGKPVELGIIRDGKPMTLSVTVEEQPQTFGSSRVPQPRVPERSRDSVAVDKIGVEAVDMTDDLAETLGFREGRKGAVITRVDRDGLGWEGGLRRGLLVTQVDKKAVTSARGLRDLVEAGSLDRGILLRVETPQGGTSYVLLKANADAQR